VRVPSNLEIQPYETGAIDIEVRLILICNRVSILTLSSEALGDYAYELVLQAVQAGPEPPLYFDVHLGNRHIQKFQFVHYLAAKVQYTCTLAPEAIAMGFLLEKTIVDANPADLDGLTVEVPIVYEPWVVGHDTHGMMIVTNAIGGTYTVKLYGSCYNPIPQGPIICLGGKGTINFRNVFNDVVEYVYMVDNHAFTVSKGEKMTPKNPTKIGVTYKNIPSSPSNGKLTITCPTYGPWVWLFYLQGV